MESKGGYSVKRPIMSSKITAAFDSHSYIVIQLRLNKVLHDFCKFKMTLCNIINPLRDEKMTKTKVK